MGKSNQEVFIAITRDSVYYDPHLQSDFVALIKGVRKKSPIEPTHLIEFYDNVCMYAQMSKTEA